MTEDVAVEHKVADIRPAEVNTELAVGKWVVGILVPEGNLDHVEVLTSYRRGLTGAIDFEVILRLH